MGALKYFLNRRFLLVAAALLASCVGANMMALALFLLVRPFSRSLYRRLVAQYVACMWIDALSLLLPGANIQITADSDMPDGITAGIVVANHQYEGDWWFMLMVARFLGLHGNVKIIVRDSLRHVPLLGWLLQLVEYPFIASSWSQSRAPLLHLLRSFTCDGLPVLLFQFPEGDRIDARVRQQSLSFAQKERRPQLLHVLLPRTTGFNACIEGLRTSHPYVYDMTIAFPGYSGQAPSAVGGGLLDSFLRFCTGEGPKEVHVRLKRYQLEEVLADPHWLDNRWAEKDRVLTYFGRTEQFPAQANNGAGGHHARGPRAPGHPVPVGSAGSAPYLRQFNTRAFKAETSALALVRLCLTPLTLPVLALLACPLLSMYVVVTTLRRWVVDDPVSPGGGAGGMIPRVSSRGEKEGLGDGAQQVTPLPIPTPFLPQTPFTSPLISAFDLGGVAGPGATAAATAAASAAGAGLGGQSPTAGRGKVQAGGGGGGGGQRIRSFDAMGPSPAPVEEGDEEAEAEEGSGGEEAEAGSGSEGGSVEAGEGRKQPVLPPPQQDGSWSFSMGGSGSSFASSASSGGCGGGGPRGGGGSSSSRAQEGVGEEGSSGSGSGSGSSSPHAPDAGAASAAGTPDPASPVSSSGSGGGGGGGPVVMVVGNASSSSSASSSVSPLASAGQATGEDGEVGMGAVGLVQRKKVQS